MAEGNSGLQNRIKIGIMGGTFNPIHVGHLMLAEWAMEAAGLDRILFIPAGYPYMKNKSHILEGHERLKMVELAIEGNPRFEASGMEIEREGNTYTCDTMELLKSMYPDAQLYFIMGADCLYSIERWKAPERIFNACHVIAAARNGSPIDEMELKRSELKDRFGANIQLLQFPAMEISSTDIRERAKRGASLRYLVPENVREYIIREALYHEDTDLKED